MSRDDFEKLFPVPEGVVWDDQAQRYVCFHADEDSIDSLRIQNSRWQGFQAGHAAGLEDAAQECERLEPDTRSRPGYVVRAHDNVCAAAAAIRAMKEQKK